MERVRAEELVEDSAPLRGRETRLGVLIPSTNNMLERDAHAFLPRSVSAHFSRMRYDRSSADPLATLRKYAYEAASLLADAGMDVVAFGCTTGSLVGGLRYDLDLARSLREIAGVPVLTTASAVIDALRAAGATRITLVTPYTPSLNEKVIAYLQEQEIEVVACGGFNTTDPDQIPLIRPEALLQAALELDNDRSEAVFLSCTALRGMECMEAVRRKAGKPVITSNQATYRSLVLEAGNPQLIHEMRNSAIFNCLKPAET